MQAVDDEDLELLRQRDAALREQLELRDEQVAASHEQVEASLDRVISQLQAGAIHQPAQRAQIRASIEELPELERFASRRAEILRLLDAR